MDNYKGIVRNCDGLGRFVIPKELRTLYGIQNGDDMEVLGIPEGILIRKLETTCFFCSKETKNLVLNKHVCSACQKKLNSKST